jgi:hypothetical protein
MERRRLRLVSLTWILSSLLVGSPAAVAKNPSNTTSDQKSLVEVRGRLLHYEDDHPWFVGGPDAALQGRGKAPLGRFEVSSPAAYARRTFEVLLKCKQNGALVPALRSGVGRSFVLVLPRDFLRGTYSRIEDCSVDPAATRRWRLAKPR